MKAINKLILAAVFMLGLNACKPNLEGYLPLPGDANFTTYVAIGNSLTAGYADGALSADGQQYAFPLMLAEQFALVGGGEFKVPYMPAGNGNNGSGVTKRILYYLTNCAGQATIGSRPASGTASSLASIANKGPFNLMGIPGARAVDISSGIYSSLNPFLNRIVETPGFNSILTEVLRQNPTFFTLWLGSNDVLGFATSGGLGIIDPAIPMPGDLSAVNQVAGSLTVLVDSLVRRGAKGVIANIPDVTAIPYFNTSPYNGVMLSKGAADTLNQLYTQLGLTHITWKEGANPFIVEDTTVAHPSLRVRQARAGELMLITIPGDSLRCAKWGVDPTKALTDEYFLDTDEMQAILSHTAQYNAAIANIASTFNIGLVDMNAYFKKFTAGFVYNGVKLNAEYISGGAFSVDAVHPNPRGYALVANEFIRVINAKYNASIPDVEVTKYPGIIFP